MIRISKHKNKECLNQENTKQEKNQENRGSERTQVDETMTPKKTHSEEEHKQELSECEKLQEEIAEKTNLFMRLQAEFANYKRRTEEQNTKVYSTAVGDVLKKFIAVFDDFELALKTAGKSNPEDFRKGIELIFAKFVTTSEDLGLKKIDAEGKHFDPQLHEALLTEETEDKEQVILEELQSGYQLNDTVLRTAKVKVSKPRQ